jgi:hypothetical protein
MACQNGPSPGQQRWEQNGCPRQIGGFTCSKQ